MKFCVDCGSPLAASPSATQAASVAPVSAPAAAAAATPSNNGSPTRSREEPTRTQVPQPKCMKCGTLNPVGNRFCASCGTELMTAGSRPQHTDSAVAGRIRPAPERAAPLETAGAAAVVPIAAARRRSVTRGVCGKCGSTNNPSGAAYCQYCATPLSEATSPEIPHRRVETGRRSEPPPELANNPAPLPAHMAGLGEGALGMPSAGLTVITQDGTPGHHYPITAPQFDIGREEGEIQLANDPYVCSRHLRITWNGSRFSASDLGSVNGAYVRLRQPTLLKHGDLLLVGLEVLRFELVSDAEQGLGVAYQAGTRIFGSPAEARRARLCQRTMEGLTRNLYYLTADRITIGRESGDIVFTSDPFMSRQHAQIIRDPVTGTFTLRDLESSNGTYLAIRGELPLQHGDHFRVGQHLFRMEAGKP